MTGEMTESQAFEQLFHTYYGKVYSYALRVTGLKWLSEEITQTVFYKVWLHKADLFGERKRPDGNIGGYIFMITRNEVAEYYRSRKDLLAFREQFAVSVCAEVEATAHLDYAECVRIVDEVVNAMPRQRRTVFVLSRYKELSNQEIARLLSLSKRTVERHISLALASLRRGLATYIA